MAETGMSLQLSASSLQNFSDCPRRFQLRHVLGVDWPLPVAEPVDVWESHQQRAQDFHRLAQQYLLGMPESALEKSIDDPNVARWWQAFKDYAAGLLGAVVLPEVGLSISFLGHRLSARYDALAVYGVSERGEAVTSRTGDGPARFVILDWKTYRRRPTRAWLASRLQTAVYPLVLAQGGQLFGVRALGAPEDIELHYWLTEDPKQPEVFGYSTGRHAADVERLTGLITDINQLMISDRRLAWGEPWQLTADWQLCRFCNYRSLCDRGSRASHMDLADAFEVGDVEDDAAAEVDDGMVNQVAETAFW